MLIKFIVINESFTFFITVISGEHCANKELLNEPHTVYSESRASALKYVSLLWEICCTTSGVDGITDYNGSICFVTC